MLILTMRIGLTTEVASAPNFPGTFMKAFRGICRETCASPSSGCAHLGDLCNSQHIMYTRNTSGPSVLNKLSMTACMTISINGTNRVSTIKYEYESEHKSTCVSVLVLVREVGCVFARAESNDIND